MHLHDIIAKVPQFYMRKIYLILITDMGTNYSVPMSVILFIYAYSFS